MSSNDSSPVMQIFILRPGLASIPKYATEGAAGLDLSAALEAPMILEPGQRAAVPTGLSIALPKGHEGQVRPRSGLSSKHGVTCVNSPGTIDEDYRGEVAVLLINLGQVAHTIQPGDRIAQLVVAPVTRVAVLTVESADKLGSTNRGEGGFGSTGR